MLILFVYLVSMNCLMIKTEENVVSIQIKGGGKQDTCDVRPKVILVEGNKFTLEVQSDYFIKKSRWQHKERSDSLQELKNSTFSINHKRTIYSSGEEDNTFIYTYSHTHRAHKRSGGSWIFTFELLMKYDPWLLSDQNQDAQHCSCRTSVEILPSSRESIKSFSTTVTPGHDTSGSDGGVNWLIIFVSMFGILLLVQSSYIVYGNLKTRSCKSNRNNNQGPISSKSPKTKRGAKPRENIADRLPLPLPPDAVVKEEPMPPPMPPMPKRHHLSSSATAPPIPFKDSYNSHPAGQFVPKQSYRNKGLDISGEGVKSPAFARRQMEGPLVPKKSYRNKGLDNSDEVIRSPGFPRRYIEGPLVQKQSYSNKALDDSEEELRSPGLARRPLETNLAHLPPKGVTASNSFRLPKPLPCSPPSPTPEKAPAFHPAHRKVAEPAPPLHPKKMQSFPQPSAPCRRPDPRMSDDEWQYEKLQPASNYLNNFSDIPYHNM